MLGAIAGDVIGSVHEWAGTKTKDFPLFVPDCTFTDDSVLTIAVADWLLNGNDLVDTLHEYTEHFPQRGYGAMYLEWAMQRRREPYNSFGNGAAMRVSPVGFAFGGIDDVLAWSARSSAVTHDHPEGIRGAQAIATAISLARQGSTKAEIKGALESRFGYDLARSLDQIRPGYEYDITCQGTVPQAVIAFLESVGFEDAIRNAISLGGDADTLACITGGIAEAFYGGIPDDILMEVVGRLDKRLILIIKEFYERFAQQRRRSNRRSQ
jgi:ADP-ribosylglycohydrolase